MVKFLNPRAASATILLNGCGMENYGRTVNVQGSVAGCAHYVRLQPLQKRNGGLGHRQCHTPPFARRTRSAALRCRKPGRCQKAAPQKIFSGHVWSHLVTFGQGATPAEPRAGPNSIWQGQSRWLRQRGRPTAPALPNLDTAGFAARLTFPSAVFTFPALRWQICHRPNKFL